MISPSDPSHLPPRITAVPPILAGLAKTSAVKIPSGTDPLIAGILGKPSNLLRSVTSTGRNTEAKFKLPSNLASKLKNALASTDLEDDFGSNFLSAMRDAVKTGDFVIHFEGDEWVDEDGNAFYTPDADTKPDDLLEKAVRAAMRALGS